MEHSLTMIVNRRWFLSLSAGALATGLLRSAPAAAADAPEALTLIEPLGQPSIIWTAFDILRPALGRILNAPASIDTVKGDDGFKALRAALTPAAGEARVFGSAVMATQYAESLQARDVRVETLLPVARLTTGFSVAMFARRGAAPAAWSDIASAKDSLRVSSLERATAAYIAEQMVERRGGIVTAVTLRDTIPEVIADVIEGRTAVGILPTTLVAAEPDKLQPIVTFGARRNPVLWKTPTFAEMVGNPKLSFTESVGAWVSPQLGQDKATGLTRAFVAAGDSPEAVHRATEENFPLAVEGPDVLLATMERNARVLKRIFA
jgi:hypothetical protein